MDFIFIFSFMHKHTHSPTFTHTSVFDNLHPTHGDHDYDITDEQHSPLLETGNYHHHHLEDHLEDEDPYHGLASVGYVESDKHKPVGAAPVVAATHGEGHIPVIVDTETASKVEEELVDHKLNEAHGALNRKIAAIAAKESLAPGPTPATPVRIHDSVVHHPRLSPINQKYDYPNRNPSPTSPILVKARLLDASFGDEAHEMAAEDNRAENVRTEQASARSIKSAQKLVTKTDEKAPSAALAGKTKEQNSKKTIISGASSDQPDSSVDSAVLVDSDGTLKDGIAKK